MEEKTQSPSGGSGAEQKKGQNTGMAVLAYIIFFLPLLTDARNDPFVKYHVKQGLVLFISCVIVGIIGWIPVIGWIMPLLSLVLFIIFIIGILNVLNGRQKPLPLIGQFAEKFQF